MPIYKYICVDCGGFDQSSSMKEYKSEVDCPKCSKLSLRDYENDLGLGCVNIPKTLGALADKNAKTYSADQKRDMLAEQHNYKHKSPYPVERTNFNKKMRKANETKNTG